MNEQPAPVTPSEKFAAVQLERILAIWHRCEASWNAQQDRPPMPDAFLPMVLETGSLRAQMRLKRAAERNEEATFGNRKMPRIGEFLRGIGMLVAVDDGFVVPPEVQPLNYIFEESEAQARMMKGKVLLKSYSTFNDFYGKGRCVDDAIKEARSICSSMSVTATGELEIVVIKTTSQSRQQITMEENPMEREYVRFTRLAHRSQWDVKEPQDEVVWSSRRDLAPVGEVPSGEPVTA